MERSDRPRRAARLPRARQWGVASALTTIVALAAVVAGPTLSMASAPAPPPGFTTVFADDFAGPAGSAPSSANWIFDTGHGYPGAATNWGTGEVESMTASTSNVFLDGGGNLHIRALRDAAGNWTSGRLETARTDFQPPAGGVIRFQASIQMPNVSGAGALGYWPAFWMLGAPFRGVFTNWPSVGEMDVMESVNAVQTEFGTLHCGVSPGGPCNETTGLGGRVGCSCWGQLHTYTLEWDRSVSPETLRWFLDGVQFFTLSSTAVDATTWANATRHGFFVLLDLAVGGGFPAAFGGGPTGATASGGEMVVDYVAVFSRGAGGPTPSPPPPTPTPGGGTISARSTIQAESFAAKSAHPRTEPTTDAGGGQDVGFIGNGDWLRYDNVDFGSSPLTQFVARVASGAGSGISGLVEVHLDSLSNPPAGSFAVANTGGWQSWRTVPANTNGTAGVHTVFLKFVTGSGQDFVNVNWFTFSP
jgi:beta-glucanase (GH16 family)